MFLTQCMINVTFTPIGLEADGNFAMTGWLGCVVLESEKSEFSLDFCVGL
jgi:hypothetical protein